MISKKISWIMICVMVVQSTGIVNASSLSWNSLDNKLKAALGIGALAATGYTGWKMYKRNRLEEDLDSMMKHIKDVTDETIDRSQVYASNIEKYNNATKDFERFLRNTMLRWDTETTGYLQYCNTMLNKAYLLREAIMQQLREQKSKKVSDSAISEQFKLLQKVEKCIQRITDHCNNRIDIFVKNIDAMKKYFKEHPVENVVGSRAIEGYQSYGNPFYDTYIYTPSDLISLVKNYEDGLAKIEQQITVGKA